MLPKSKAALNYEVAAAMVSVGIVSRYCYFCCCKVASIYQGYQSRVDTYLIRETVVHLLLTKLQMLAQSVNLQDH